MWVLFPWTVGGGVGAEIVDLMIDSVADVVVGAETLAPCWGNDLLVDYDYSLVS